jgi:hypothetical protein
VATRSATAWFPLRSKPKRKRCAWLDPADMCG